MARVWLGKTPVIRRLGFALGAAFTLLVVLLSWAGGGVLTRLENDMLDLRFLLRGERHAGSDVLIVAIDEASLKEVGRWPWSRATQAELIRGISADRPKVIGIDIIFSEPETTEYRKAWQELASIVPAGPAFANLRALLARRLREADADGRLAESFHAAGNVVLALPLLVSPEAGDVGDGNPAPAPAHIKKSQFLVVQHATSGQALEPQRATDSAAPLKPLAEESASLGQVYSLPDIDGITRHEYLAMAYGPAGEFYPSLGLEVARLYLEIPRDQMTLMLGEGIRLGSRVIPTDQKARMLIDHAGREGRFRYVSATDVIHKRVQPGLFAGKAVLVGTSGLGTYDQKATPFSANFPGVEKNATVVENIIHRRFLTKSIWAGPLDVALTIVFGLTLAYALPRLQALQGFGLAAVLFLGYLLVAQYLFVAQGQWVDVVGPTLVILLTYLAIMLLRFMTEERQAREIRAMFSSYVSPRIVAELIKDPSKATLGGQRRELTMLFADVVGFTSFSEKHSAEEVVAQLNEYLTAMTEVVFQWNGTLDKFAGDAIVVFWGAPLDQPDHVELAVNCARHMRKRLGELQDKWRAEGKVPLDNGIGINTGHALVGNIGAEGKKMDYTMIGDHVNLAARVEGLTRTLDCPIILTEYTAERLAPLMRGERFGDRRDGDSPIGLRRLGAMKVKGKDQAIVVYGLGSKTSQAAGVVDEQAPEDSVTLSDK